jgi:hypothetical protein
MVGWQHEDLGVSKNLVECLYVLLGELQPQGVLPTATLTRIYCT